VGVQLHAAPPHNQLLFGLAALGVHEVSDGQAERSAVRQHLVKVDVRVAGHLLSTLYLASITAIGLPPRYQTRSGAILTVSLVSSVRGSCGRTRPSIFSNESVRAAVTKSSKTVAMSTMNPLGTGRRVRLHASASNRRRRRRPSVAGPT
jgi:hypothetical protein